MALFEDVILPEKMDKTRIIQEAKAQAKLERKSQ
jgi:hypothetical protein